FHRADPETDGGGREHPRVPTTSSDALRAEIGSVYRRATPCITENTPWWRRRIVTLETGRATLGFRSSRLEAMRSTLGRRIAALGFNVHAPSSYPKPRRHTHGTSHAATARRGADRIRNTARCPLPHRRLSRPQPHVRALPAKRLKRPKRRRR